MKIKFCSAPCGSGKTYQIIELACQLAAAGFYVLILQPTKELIDKTVERELLTRHNPPYHKVFYTDADDGRSVASQLIEHFNCPFDGGHIVFATHQVLPFIRHWSNKSQWHVFIDEELQIAKQCCLQIPDTHSLITTHIDLEQSGNIYSRVVVTDPNADPDALKEIARNKNQDEIYELFREPAQLLTNPHWHSFASTEQFDKLKAGTVNTLSIHSLLTSHIFYGFASVTMASANFADTMIYKVWSRDGVTFEEDTAFANSLRFREHQNGVLITIKYLTNRAWSQYLQIARWNPDDPSGQTYLDLLIETAKNEMQDQRFLWQANKSVPDRTFSGRAERLPNVPHGLNDYSHLHNTVFLSALNPRPDHYRFLATKGVDGLGVRRAIYCSAVYQSVMRTSIRDLQNTDPKTIIVPDLAAALYLQKLFPGSKLEQLKTKLLTVETSKPIGRPRKHLSPAVRQATYRQRKKQQLLSEVFPIKNLPYLGKLSFLSRSQFRQMTTNFCRTALSPRSKMLDGVSARKRTVCLHLDSIAERPVQPACSISHAKLRTVPRAFLRTTTRKNVKPLTHLNGFQIASFLSHNRQHVCSDSHGRQNSMKQRSRKQGVFGASQSLTQAKAMTGFGILLWL